mgnify:CR=1 FL=1
MCTIYLFVTLRSLKNCPWTKKPKNEITYVQCWLKQSHLPPSRSFTQRSSRKKLSRQRQIEQTNFTLGNTIQIIRWKRKEESETTHRVTLKTDRFRCVCTVRCSPRMGEGVGRIKRKERCTRDIAGFRLSSITRLDVSLPCYGCSSRKFASPPGLSRSENSHLNAVLRLCALPGYRDPFNPYFRRRSVSTVASPFVFEPRAAICPELLSREYYVASFSPRGKKRRRRAINDESERTNERTKIAIEKCSSRMKIERSGLFTWTSVVFVTECTFPPKWEGTWFQSGVRQPIVISRNELSSKGRCLHNEGDKFLLVDQWVYFALFYTL